MRNHLLSALALFLIALPVAAQTAVTGAGAAAFPSPAALEGVSLASLRFGIGVDLAADGTASGSLAVTLLGAAGRNVVVEGTPDSGSADPVLGVATFSGTCTVDPGDGTPLRTGVPFTATLAPADGGPALTLVVGATTLPGARVTRGTVRIR